MISKYILDTLDRILNGERPSNIDNSIETVYDVKYFNDKMYDADIFYKKGCATKGVILNIHGGGFLSGEKKGLREFCGKLAETGYFVFSINYPLAPSNPHPSPIKSALLAIDYLINHSKEYNIDMSKLYITGESAGAYISLYTAIVLLNPELSEKYNLISKLPPRSLKGLMLYCGIYDFNRAWKSRPGFIFRDMIREYTNLPNKKYLSDKDIKFYSPINFINEKLPRTLIAYAKYDPLRKQGQILDETLKKYMVKTTVYYAGRFLSMHDFQLGLKSKDAKECLKITQDFLSEEN